MDHTGRGYLSTATSASSALFHFQWNMVEMFEGYNRHMTCNNGVMNIGLEETIPKSKMAGNGYCKKMIFPFDNDIKPVLHY